MEKLYMVTFEGYFDGWGSYTYLQGIYSSKEVAEEQAAKIMLEKCEALNPYANVNVIEVTKDVPLEVTDGERFDGIQSDICLGGYAE